MNSKHRLVAGEWYVAERGMWNGDVRFVRTSEDKSGVVGVTNEGSAKLISAAPELLKACQAALTLSAVSENSDVFNKISAAVRKAVAGQ